MKNTIGKHDSNLALVNKVKDLRRFLELLKSQQAPTISETAYASVDFTLPAYNRSTNSDLDNVHIVDFTLLPLDQEVLFAIPEVDIFGNVGTPTVSINDLYPHGSSWDGGNNKSVFFDFDVWFDLWDNYKVGEASNLRAIFYIRGRSPDDINIKLVARWRYIVPGATSI